MNWDDRDVIVAIDDALHANLQDCLRARGWNLYRAHNADELAALFEQHEFHAGLMQVQRDRKNAAFDLVGCQSSLQWIALVDQPMLNPGRQYRNFLAGLYDFHTLPVDPVRLSLSLGHAWGKGQLLKPPRTASDSLESYGIIGNSAPMREFGLALRKASKANAPVLIAGESGTGKELAAHAIHAMSGRRKKAFVAVNCGALPTHLIQSELFGHEKGAFTGAHQRKIGRMEAAQGGTLFLDEIGDLPLELQSNLLRVLQDKVIQRVGSSEPLQLDIRVIAASHIDLKDAISKGHFREDLYYRLNVINLHAPPLRDRQDDIVALAQALLEKFSAENGGRTKGFSQQALRTISQYHWPGNVRELINRIRQGVIMAERPFLNPDDLGMERRVAYPERFTLDNARVKADCDAIRSALRRCQHNVSAAAKELGVSRATLYRLLERHDIDSPRKGEPARHLQR